MNEETRLLKEETYHLGVYTWDKDTLQARTGDPDDMGASFIVLKSVKIVHACDVPSPQQFKQLQIGRLTEERARIKAQAQERVETIDDKIQSLMALEAPQATIVLDDGVPF